MIIVGKEYENDAEKYWLVHEPPTMHKLSYSIAQPNDDSQQHDPEVSFHLVVLLLFEPIYVLYLLLSLSHNTSHLWCRHEF